MKDLALKIIAGVLFVFSIFGMMFVFQRETMILENQVRFAQVLEAHDKAIQEIAAYLKQEAQQKRPTMMPETKAK